MHAEADAVRHGAALFDALEAQRRAGRVGRVGLSVYTPQVALDLLDQVQALQLPFSIFDRRFASVVEAASDDTTVFARSVFLQGLFFLSDTEAQAKLPQAVAPLRQLRSLAEELDRPLDELALVFARDTPGLDYLVLGVETPEQLRRNVQLHAAPPLAPDEREALERAFADLPDSLVNPSRWPR